MKTPGSFETRLVMALLMIVVFLSIVWACQHGRPQEEIRVVSSETAVLG